MSPVSVAVETWAALLRPRRALALAAVAVPVLYGQMIWNHDPIRGVSAGLLLIASTVVVGPVAWRLLQPTKGALRTAAFLGICAACVLACGVIVPRALGFEDPFLSNTPSLAIVFGLFVAGGAGLGFDIDSERLLADEQRRSDALARDRDRAELLALRAQLDPHFLFNTLNAIAEWCVKDPVVAEAAVVRLSGVLRTVQSAVRRDTWPLPDELALCADVLALHHVRDPARFAGTVEGAAAGVTVPTMLLLPLVENAVKHGPAAGHAGAVTIRVAPDADGARITVENPGAFIGPREGGQGLDLLARRLAIAYGERATFAITSAGTGTVATLVVPRSPSEPT